MTVTMAVEDQKADILEINAAQFRNQVKAASGKEITSEQAQQFLNIFGDDYAAAMLAAQRAFIIQHFGNKNVLNK